MRPVDVIIATACLPVREPLLLRAIESAASQRDVDTTVLVVVNGPNYSRPLLERLHSIPRVVVHRLDPPSLPAAIAYGRRASRGEFFSFLDDDDLLLPGALATRLSAMEGRDVVVTSGIASSGRPIETSGDSVKADPLTALFRDHWLPSCGALYRAATVPASIFENLFKYFEWTNVALRLLAADAKIAFLPDRTFEINDTAGSLSKERTVESAACEVGLLRYAETVARTEGQRRLVRGKLGSAYHELSEAHLRAGQVSSASAAHVRALRLGSKTIPYTRHILKEWLRFRKRPG